MVARMHARPKEAEEAFEYAEPARIITFPTTEWDRLERWAQRELAKEAHAIRLRNAALSRI
ncbi:MAG: hypothetical protein QOF21_1795 [Actinomycetota bacterium]